MMELWEYAKGFWTVVDFILGAVYLLCFPFFTIALWRLVWRLDLIYRLDDSAKVLTGPDKLTTESPEEFRKTMARHEKAVKAARYGGKL